jgi:hypothetical protein
MRTIDDPEKAVERAFRERMSLLESIIQIARWLLATLFVVNGAATLATLSMPEQYSSAALGAGESFVSGVSSAIYAGVFGFFALYSALGHADMRVNRWNERKKWYPKVSIAFEVVGGVLLWGCFGFGALSAYRFETGLQIIAKAKEHNVPRLVRANDNQQPVNIARPVR